MVVEKGTNTLTSCRPIKAKHLQAYRFSPLLLNLLLLSGIPLVPCRGAGKAEAFGAAATATEISHTRLKQMLTYPADWGPTEWGPIPFLPEPDILVSSMERQWGDLAAYRGIATSASGWSAPPPCMCCLIE